MGHWSFVGCNNQRLRITIIIFLIIISLLLLLLWMLLNILFEDGSKSMAANRCQKYMCVAYWQGTYQGWWQAF